MIETRIEEKKPKFKTWMKDHALEIALLVGGLFLIGEGAYRKGYDAGKKETKDAYYIYAPATEVVKDEQES